MRKKRPFTRSEDQVRDTSLVVIACEDQYAVRQYFDCFGAKRIHFKVLETTDGQSSPDHVMQRLTNYMDDPVNQFEPSDAFWLVLDTDHWIERNHISNLTTVLSKCRQKGIGVALSNPCFELWLLLHFADFPAGQDLSCDDVCRMLRNEIGSYQKSKVHAMNFTNENVRKAVEQSKANFDAKCDIPIQTSQTAVHLIIDSLIARSMIEIYQ